MAPQTLFEGSLQSDSCGWTRDDLGQSRQIWGRLEFGPDSRTFRVVRTFS